MISSSTAVATGFDRPTRRANTRLMARRVVWLGGAAALILIQIFVRGPGQRLLWSEVLNAGHAPLYGLVAVAILHVLEPGGGRREGPRVRLYLLALLLTVAAGVLAELIQGVTGGDADPMDVARDAAGASAFLLAVSAFDPGLFHSRIRAHRPAAILLAALTLAVTFASVTSTAADFLQRDAAFPMLCEFETHWGRRFISENKVRMEICAPPEGWTDPPSSGVARLTFQSGRYPGLAIREPHPDWRGFKELVFEVFSDNPEPIELDLRIHDRDHNNEYSDRFNRALTIEPGTNRISIALQDVESAPRGRRMNMSRIQALALFADHPGAPFVLYLDDLRLE
jgi:hypothetical protein